MALRFSSAVVYLLVVLGESLSTAQVYNTYTHTEKQKSRRGFCEQNIILSESITSMESLSAHETVRIGVVRSDLFYRVHNLLFLHKIQSTKICLCVIIMFDVWI